jgi:hypothetical protein
VAANLERRQIGEQFRILDPASLPERPYNQSRRVAATASGAVAGLLLGLVLVGLIEYRDATLKSEADVLRILSLPVLTLIPVITTTREHRRERLRAWAANMGAGVALVGALGIVVAWRLHWLQL